MYSDIINGVYAANETLPSETALATKYGVSRNTLRQALAILNEDGMIIKSQGKGTIISPQPVHSSKNEFSNPLLTLSKHPITDTVISYNYGSPTDIAKDKLNLSKSDIILACNCVFKSNETILGFSFTQFPSAYFNLVKLNTGDDESIKETILSVIFEYSKNINIDIKLIYANEMEIAFLHIPLGTPLILIEAIHYEKNGLPLARNKFYFIPEHYHLNLNLSNSIYK